MVQNFITCDRQTMSSPRDFDGSGVGRSLGVVDPAALLLRSTSETRADPKRTGL
jgi:hypothetical protein